MSEVDAGNARILTLLSWLLKCNSVGEVRASVLPIWDDMYSHHLTDIQRAQVEEQQHWQQQQSQQQQATSSAVLSALPVTRDCCSLWNGPTSRSTVVLHSLLSVLHSTTLSFVPDWRCQVERALLDTSVQRAAALTLDYCEGCKASRRLVFRRMDDGYRCVRQWAQCRQLLVLDMTVASFVALQSFMLPLGQLVTARGKRSRERSGTVTTQHEQHTRSHHRRRRSSISSVPDNNINTGITSTPLGLHQQVHDTWHRSTSAPQETISYGIHQLEPDPTSQFWSEAVSASGSSGCTSSSTADTVSAIDSCPQFEHGMSSGLEWLRAVSSPAALQSIAIEERPASPRSVSPLYTDFNTQDWVGELTVE